MNTKELTEGNPLKLIILFMLPLFIGNFFQQVYNFTDAIIVSRFIGVKSLGSVGATVPIIFFFISFIFASTQGFTMITAQRFGAKDYENVRKSLVASFFLAFLLTIFLTIISTPFSTNILKLMHTPEDLLEHSSQYLFIMLAGIIATVYYNLSSNIIRALGNSKTPLYFLIFSVFLNILFDLLFVIKFRWGIQGAGWATVISEFISTILCTSYLFTKFPILHLQKSDFKISASFLFEHVRIGIPMGIQMSVLTLGMLAVQYVLNTFGSRVVSGYTAAMYVAQIFGQSFIALGATMAVYSAQNYGAKKMTRIKSGIRAAVFIALILCTCFFIIIKMFSTQILSLFITTHEQDIINYAKTYLDITIVFYIFLGILIITRNTLQGMGNVVAPLISGFAELIARSSFAFILGAHFGYIGVCTAGPAAWISGAIVLYIAYKISFIKFMKNKKNINYDMK